MNAWLFLICILLLEIISIVLFKNFLSPTVELISMYLIASVCYVLIHKTWGVDLSVKTMFVVIIALVFFGIGEFLAVKTPLPVSILNKTPFIGKQVGFCGESYSFGKRVFRIGIVVEILTILLRYRFAVKVSEFLTANYGYDGPIMGAVYNNHYVQNGIIEPQLNTFFIVISECFAFYCCYIFIRELVLKRTVKHMYIVPIILMVVFQLFDGGRAFLIRDIFVILFISVYMVCKNGDEKKVLKIILFLGTAAVILFVSMYFIYGFIRGGFKIDEGLKPAYLLGYPASSLQALNIYLESPSKPEFFGEETLVVQKQILNKLGFNFTVGSLPLDYVCWKGYDTNIYTSIRRYFHDFGYSGVLIIQAAIGYFYGYLRRIATDCNVLWILILYAQLGHTIIMSIFDERFFQQVANAGTVYFIIALPLISLLLKENKESCKFRYYL